MSEFIELRKTEAGTNRRWFMSPDLDLIIFYDESGSIREFQFCYDKNKHEQMLSWNETQGYSHMAIDDGDTLSSLGHKRTPLIVPNGKYSIDIILKKIEGESETLPSDLVDFIKDKLVAHPDYGLTNKTE